MQARGPLMIEHRLIEKMLAIVKKALLKINTEERIDPLFVDSVVDFIKIYADRTHHGKEEDILFRELKKKTLSTEDRRLMDELIEDHVFGRETTRALVNANTRYRNREESALSEISDRLQTLVKFYPRHIEKEDKDFFPKTRIYFSVAEDQKLLDEFWDFDRKMIHEKYQDLVEEIENKHP